MSNWQFWSKGFMWLSIKEENQKRKIKGGVFAANERVIEMCSDFDDVNEIISKDCLRI